MAAARRTFSPIRVKYLVQVFLSKEEQNGHEHTINGKSGEESLAEANPVDPINQKHAHW
jgi:hypothetical protein